MLRQVVVPAAAIPITLGLRTWADRRRELPNRDRHQQARPRTATTTANPAKQDEKWFHWFDDGFGLVVGPDLLIAGATAYVVLLSDPQYIMKVGSEWEKALGFTVAYTGSAFCMPYLIRTFGWTRPSRHNKRRVRFWAIVVPIIWAFVLWVYSQT